MNWKKIWRAISLALTICLLTLTFSFDSSAAQRRRRHNPQAGKRKAAKRIGIGTAVGAGAVVREDIPPYAIAVGIPARVVSSRARESG